MVRCPNCGQKTSGDYCHCCKYPLLKGKPTRERKAEKLAKKQAEIDARKKARQETKEARKARVAEKLAKKQAEIDAREKATQEAEEAQKAKEAEKLAEKQAEIDAREKARQEAEEARKAKEAEKLAKKQAELYEEVEPVPSLPLDFDQVKYLEECLKQVESTREELEAGKIDTKEAIQRIRDISEKISE
jgi:hypothetical protein